jgi:hypothetical protein
LPDKERRRGRMSYGLARSDIDAMMPVHLGTRLVAGAQERSIVSRNLAELN